MRFFDTIKSAFTGPVEQPRPTLHRTENRDRDSDELRRTRYGSSRYMVSPVHGANLDYAQIRTQSRLIYSESIVAQTIVNRLVTTVVNTGLTWQSFPQWPMIPAAPAGRDAKQARTEELEQFFSLYCRLSEADVQGERSLFSLMALWYRLFLVEGEIFIVIRYRNPENRVSPVVLQTIDPDQIVSPRGTEMASVTDRGGKIAHGIEYDSSGKKVAIWVRDEVASLKAPKRIPIFGRSGRRFVIHYKNQETTWQPRGTSELQAKSYDLNRLVDYDIAELEAANASATLLGAVEAVHGSDPGKGPKLQNLNIGARKAGADGESKNGLQTVRVGGKAIILNNMEPGYAMKMFNQNRPNPNYAEFVRFHEQRMSAHSEMPYSVYSMKFDSSFSASRMEVKFFWYSVVRRAMEFSHSVLDPIREAVFTEAVASRELDMPGFSESKRVRHAWLSGQWNGVPQPSVDPLKEINAISKRVNMGHTTNEAEAKAHNGSDHRENVRRLAVENERLREAFPPEGE